ncbi:MAG TPA: glucosidase, partial [Myxococcota bacterium]|nr:glucosidase [Myxococcota bacterium]
TGTKAAAHYRLTVPAGGSARVRLRLSAAPAADDPPGEAFGAAFAAQLTQRREEADAFYASVAPPELQGTDAAGVMRQALAGMLWSKQYYYFDVDRWLEEHEGHPARVLKRLNVRNRDWFHMLNDDVISMPDKWEYPWYAAWDLAFHAVALAMIDLDFAKEQLELMLRELYLHPNGQIPAYEWNFGDVNPPVHAWATLFVFRTEQERRGRGDLRFLRRAFHKLLVNFTWWVNRKDPGGRNVFEGGFLGLDNIGVFDRSAPLPTGGHLEQADGTAWMALFAQNMLEMALLLAVDDPLYEDFALKFLEHFLWIASAMDRIGDNQDELWDEADGFFYDVLRLPDGSAQRLKVRSMVGLLPLCATTVIDLEVADRFPRLRERMERFLRLHPRLQSTIAPLDRPGVKGRRLLGALNEPKLRRVLAYLLDEGEFLSPHGVRALSRYHAGRPYVLQLAGQEYRVDYQPAESSSPLLGGNSNWRGPVWFPMNALLIRALLNLYVCYGDEFTVECPTGSRRHLTLFEVAREISD